ncbi:MAG: DinB family protein [bacterium]
MSQRANALADRIELGASALSTFAEGLSDAEWRTPVPRDGRTVGVMVHHVASVYPYEIKAARHVASGTAITGLTLEAMAQANAEHAREHAAVGKKETLDLLRRNSREAAGVIRAFTDQELDRAAPVSLHANAPLTAQFVIEDHALRHSFHHLARIRAALGR